MNRIPEGTKEVDTLRVALLGFSLISIIIMFYLTAFYVYHSSLSYLEFFPGISADGVLLIKATKTLSLFMFVLPQIVSLILWLVMPSFIKHWYNLKPLPSQYNHVYEHVERIASKMGISPPEILYTQKDVANCFNLGKREGESTIVVSRWLLHHLHMDELEAVLAHEMAHTKNRDVTLMAYLAAARRVIFLSPVFICCGFLYIFFQFGWSLTYSLLFPVFWVFVLPFLLVYFFLTLGIQWFSRLREAAADARASLFVDENVLKRALYTITCARSSRMVFVSSCVMISNAYGLDSILSTHPAWYKRHDMLDKKKHIIDYRKPLSLRLAFSSAVSIFIFLQLINFVATTLVFYTSGHLIQGWPRILLNPLIASVLFIFFYDYLSWKDLGVIIFLIAFVQFATFYVLILPVCFFARPVILPFMDMFPPDVRAAGELGIEAVVNLSDITVNLLKEAVQFFITTFLITISLKYTKRYLKLKLI